MKSRTMKNFLQQKPEHGQSLSELALIIVIIVILLAGVLDLGRALFQYLAMRDSAQEGASYATVFPNYCNDIIDRVYSSLYNSDPNEVLVNVYIDGVQCVYAAPSNACAGKEVQVVVRQPNFPLAMPFLGTFIGKQTISLEASVRDSIIRPSCP